MSKAFDTVDRTILFEHLEEILDDDGHRSVKIGFKIGKTFATTIGIIQDDSLSAILFIFYLAKCLKIPIHTKVKGFLINPTYADDADITSRNKHEADR